MKNCLIVLGVLMGCFFVAVFLIFELNMGGGYGTPGGLTLEVAEWTYYDSRNLRGLEVVISPNEIVVEVPAAPRFQMITEKGRWTQHSFLCDSHLDAPAEVEVARQLANEDLELDIGHFMPNHPGKITLVKTMRGGKDYRPPYPVYVPGQTVAYPPPRGLIHVDMLECDLQSLPWRADRLEASTMTIHSNSTMLSDGKTVTNYFPSQESMDAGSDYDNDFSPMTYNYHSDRTDAPKLLVTVYHGKVIQVAGGAEETSDIPYSLPPPSPPPPDADQSEGSGWQQWISDLLFKK